MSKEFFVLRGSRVVYLPGHYSYEGALATARAELTAHPKASVQIMRLVETRMGPLHVDYPQQTIIPNRR